MSLASAWHSKVNPFGNHEDPVPPDTYLPDIHQWQRHVAWAIRNPLHNFCFHWIGFYGKVKLVYGDWKGSGLRLTWQLLGKYWGLPLLSYNGSRVEWYVGWRPSGAFGLAFRTAKAKAA